MSVLILVLLMTLFQNGILGCFLYDIDYRGSNLNADHSIRTEDAETCHKMCLNDPQCYRWSWKSPEYYDPNYRKDCYLKSFNVVMAVQKGVISGPKHCGQGRINFLHFQLQNGEFIKIHHTINSI